LSEKAINAGRLYHITVVKARPRGVRDRDHRVTGGGDDG